MQFVPMFSVRKANICQAEHSQLAWERILRVFGLAFAFAVSFRVFADATKESHNLPPMKELSNVAASH